MKSFTGFCLPLFVITLVLGVIFTPNENAFAAAGQLFGVVSDSVSGQNIVGASVVIDKTKLTATTNSNGQFLFQTIPVGVYDVQISATGYNPLTVTGVVIEEGQVTDLKIVLTPQSLKLQERKITFVKPAVDLGKSSSQGKASAEVESLSKNTKGFKVDVEGRFHARGSHDQLLLSAPVAVDADMVESEPLIASQNELRMPSLSPPLPPPGAPFNTEEYDRIYDNEFVDALKVPLSTFSIDVDAASYSNTRRFLNGGMLPPVDAVRIEELINYFDYDYPDPSGEYPFSITTELAECPWQSDHKLLHIGLQGKRLKSDRLPPSNLTFLIDVSGSMAPENKLPLIKNAFKMLVNQLRREDRVAIVVYAGASGLVLPSTRGDRKDVLLDALDRLSAGGSTAGGAGMQLAYQTAKENFVNGGNNRVIWATDGDFNTGVSSTSEMVKMIEDRRKDGVFLTLLGVGEDNLKDSRMEQIADKGNGQYFYLDNIDEARRVMVTELSATLLTIAKDVKIQIEFNPARVNSYRLIGYENRLMKAEEFHDDKKDAGEIGAGHSVTALYEIVPAGVKENTPKIDDLKYQSNGVAASAINSSELLTLKLRYKLPDEDASKLLSQAVMDNPQKFLTASDNFRFSAAVAAFGMLLRDSKFKGSSNFRDLVEWSKSAEGNDPEGFRGEFVRMAETAERLKYSESRVAPTRYGR